MEIVCEKLISIKNPSCAICGLKHGNKCYVWEEEEENNTSGGFIKKEFHLELILPLSHSLTFNHSPRSKGTRFESQHRKFSFFAVSRSGENFFRILRSHCFKLFRTFCFSAIAAPTTTATWPRFGSSPAGIRFCTPPDTTP